MFVFEIIQKYNIKLHKVNVAEWGSYNLGMEIPGKVSAVFPRRFGWAFGSLHAFHETLKDMQSSNAIDDAVKANYGEEFFTDIKTVNVNYVDYNAEATASTGV